MAAQLKAASCHGRQASYSSSCAWRRPGGLAVGPAVTCLSFPRRHSAAHPVPHDLVISDASHLGDSVAEALGSWIQVRVRLSAMLRKGGCCACTERCAACRRCSPPLAPRCACCAPLPGKEKVQTTVTHLLAPVDALRAAADLHRHLVVRGGSQEGAARRQRLLQHPMHTPTAAGRRRCSWHSRAACRQSQSYVCHPTRFVSHRSRMRSH